MALEQWEINLRNQLADILPTPPRVAADPVPPTTAPAPKVVVRTKAVPKWFLVGLILLMSVGTWYTYQLKMGRMFHLPKPGFMQSIDDLTVETAALRKDVTDLTAKTQSNSDRIGLLGALQEIGKLIGSFSVGAGMTDPVAAVNELVARLTEPMRAMGVAFSASLFGVLGSLIMGMLMVFIKSATVELVSSKHLVLHGEGLDAYAIRRLDLLSHDVDWNRWEDLLQRVHHPAYEVTVALVGKYIDLPDAYLSVTEALRHAIHDLLGDLAIRGELAARDGDDAARPGRDGVLA